MVFQAEVVNPREFKFYKRYKSNLFILKASHVR